MKTTPTGAEEKLSAHDIAQKQLDKELGVGAAKAQQAAVVNDLTGMVKKKKPKKKK